MGGPPNTVVINVNPVTNQLGVLNPVNQYSYIMVIMWTKPTQENVHAQKHTQNRGGVGSTDAILRPKSKSKQPTT